MKFNVLKPKQGKRPIPQCPIKGQYWEEITHICPVRGKITERVLVTEYEAQPEPAGTPVSTDDLFDEISNIDEDSIY